jgi:hypothetical protein
MASEFRDGRGERQQIASLQINLLAMASYDVLVNSLCKSLKESKKVPTMLFGESQGIVFPSILFPFFFLICSWEKGEKGMGIGRIWERQENWPF